MTRLAAIVLVLIAILIVGAHGAAAAEKGRVWRIGTLLNGSPATRGHFLEWWRQGLKKLGYVEGGNYVFVSRWRRGKRERLPILAKELVDARVDIILVAGNSPLRAAANATRKIPIVVGSATGLGTWGFVASLAKPGGNVTGSTALDPGLEGKRLQLVREVSPSARRVGFLFFPTKRGRAELRRSQTAGSPLGMEIQPFPMKSPEQIESRFGSMKRQKTDVLIMNSNAVVISNRQRVGELVKERKLPTICATELLAKDACLLTYVADWSLMNRRATVFVAKILKGANPGDLPVERPTKYKMIVNQKLAKALGITVPSSILLRADDVIE